MRTLCDVQWVLFAHWILAVTRSRSMRLNWIILLDVMATWQMCRIQGNSYHFTRCERRAPSFNFNIEKKENFGLYYVLLLLFASMDVVSFPFARTRADWTDGDWWKIRCVHNTNGASPKWTKQINFSCFCWFFFRRTVSHAHSHPYPYPCTHADTHCDAPENFSCCFQS